MIISCFSAHRGKQNLLDDIMGPLILLMDQGLFLELFSCFIISSIVSPMGPLFFWTHFCEPSAFQLCYWWMALWSCDAVINLGFSLNGSSRLDLLSLECHAFASLIYFFGWLVHILQQLSKKKKRQFSEPKSVCMCLYCIFIFDKLTGCKILG